MAMKFTLLLYAAGITATLMAQDTSSIPGSRGVYYRADSGWVGLTGTVLMPMISNTAADLFSVGPKQAVAELPGPRASLQTSNAKPTLYVRGFPMNNGIYLIHETQRSEYREIHMPISWQFSEFAHLRSKDMREIEIRPAGGNLYAVTPRADLAPGEYAIVSLIEPNDRFIKIGYDFGVAGGSRK